MFLIFDDSDVSEHEYDEDDEEGVLEYAVRLCKGASEPEDIRPITGSSDAGAREYDSDD